MTDCVTGCKHKPKPEQAEGDPKQAVEGLLCRGCYTKLTGWLRDIPVDYALLPMVSESGSGQRLDGTSRSKQPEAPTPIRLEILALRARPVPPTRVKCGCGCGHQVHQSLKNIRDYGDPDDGIPQVFTTLHVWAHQLRCELDPTRDYDTPDADGRSVPTEARYLLNAALRLSERPWVDECMTDIQTVWVWLTRVHGLLAGPSMGVCFEVTCNGKIYRDKFTGIPACRACKRVYNDPDDWIKLKLSDVG